MASPNSRSFNVKYAGWIQEIRSDIDPMSRIDLLKIIDTAQADGYINNHFPQKEFKEDAILAIGCDGVKISLMNRDQEVLLTVPINMIASIGVVAEDSLNIVPVKISSDNEINDLAVIYARTREQALEICNHMNACFQIMYQQSISNVKKPFSNKMKLYGSEYADPGMSLQSPAVITECSQTLSSSTGSSPQNEEMINEYITMITLCLNQEELNQFAIHMKMWRQGEIRMIKEFGKKLLEIFGTERKHLLGRMRHLLGDVSTEDLNELNKFFLANGVTENAANSPLITAEMSLTTDGCSPALDNISGCSGIFAQSQPK